MSDCIEQYVIDRVREKRQSFGVSQRLLSIKLKMDEGFVAAVENPNRNGCYRLNHLEVMARLFKCSPRDFLPEGVD